jgi:hypothetical protein
MLRTIILAKKYFVSAERFIAEDIYLLVSKNYILAVCFTRFCE